MTPIEILFVPHPNPLKRQVILRFSDTRGMILLPTLTVSFYGVTLKLNNVPFNVDPKNLDWSRATSDCEALQGREALLHLAIRNWLHQDNGTVGQSDAGIEVECQNSRINLGMRPV